MPCRTTGKAAIFREAGRLSSPDSEAIFLDSRERNALGLRPTREVGRSRQFLRESEPVWRSHVLLMQGVVAQLVRALDCRSRGCGFEPRRRRLKARWSFFGQRAFFLLGPIVTVARAKSPISFDVLFNPRSVTGG